jgi:hypothetical protein
MQQDRTKVAADFLACPAICPDALGCDRRLPCFRRHQATRLHVTAFHDRGNSCSSITCSMRHPEPAILSVVDNVRREAMSTAGRRSSSAGM